MQLLRAVVVSCASCFAATSCAGTQVSGGPQAMREVALPANAALDSAYRRGDADAAAQLMSDSVVISAENIPDLVGRSTIRDILRQFFTVNSVAAFTLSPAELQIYGDRAFERGTFVWSSGPKGGAMTRRSGRYMLLRARDSAGAWKLLRYIENCLPAPCP
jgi:ketosteroid isomerase-like protein